jgi:hypothetical protein
MGSRPRNKRAEMKAKHEKWMAEMEADRRETEAMFKMMDKMKDGRQ